MSKSFRKVMVVILTTIIVFSSIAPLFAAVSQADYEEMEMGVIDLARTFESNYYSQVGSSGVYAQMYSARQIFNYNSAMFALLNCAQKTDSSDFSTVYSMAKILQGMIDSYNYNFSDSKVPSLPKNLTKTKKLVRKSKKIAKWYVQDVVFGKAAELTGGIDQDVSDEDVDKIRQEHAAMCEELYSSAEYGIDTLETLNSLMAEDDSGVRLSFVDLYTYKGAIKDVSTVIDVFYKYAEVFPNLYNIGARISEENSAISDSLYIDVSKSTLENMATVKIVENDVDGETKSKIEIEEDPQLSLAYLAILSAGASYVPFKSRVGDARFMKALDSLCESNEVSSSMNAVYNDLKLYKKPVYFRTLDSSGTPDGEASLITAGELFSKIKSGSAGSLCTVLGQMTLDNSTGNWVFCKEVLDSSLVDTLGTYKEVDQSQNSLGTTSSAAVTTGTTAYETTLQNVLNKLNPFGVEVVSATEIERNPVVGFRVPVSTNEIQLENFNALAAPNSNGSVGFFFQDCNNFILNLSEFLKNPDAGTAQTFVESWVYLVANCRKDYSYCDRIDQELTFTTLADDVEIDSSGKIVRNGVEVTDLDDATKTVNLQLKKDGFGTAAEDYEDGGIRYTTITNLVKLLDESLTYGSLEATSNDVVSLTKGSVSDWPFSLDTTSAEWESLLTDIETKAFADSFSRPSPIRELNGNELKNGDPFWIYLAGLIAYNLGQKNITDYANFVNYVTGGEIDTQDTFFEDFNLSIFGTADGNDTLNQQVLSNLVAAHLGSGANTNSVSSNSVVLNNSLSSYSVASGNSTYVTEPVTEQYQFQTYDFDTAISAGMRIADESRMSGSILLFGSLYARDVDNSTTAIYSNILNSANNFNLSEIESEYLYVNSFGDIVTADDLIIFPGIANPLLYKDGVAYNPFSVAFMNSYPSNIRNSAYYRLSTSSDVGKYSVFLDSAKQTESANIEAYNQAVLLSNKQGIALDNFNFDQADLEFALINSSSSVKQTQTLTSVPIYNYFIYNKSETLQAFRLQSYFFNSNLIQQKNNNQYVPLISSGSMMINNQFLFPYDYSSDLDGVKASTIAKNLYQYLTMDFETNEYSNLGKLNDNWIIHYMLISGWEGTNDTFAFNNSMNLTYSSYYKNTVSRAVDSIVNFSEIFTGSLTNVDGVLGIKNSYEDKILGKIVTLLRSYWVIFLILFMFVIVIAILRFRRDLLQSLFLIILAGLLAYVFVYLAPIYLPMGYNFLVNNVADQFAYEILMQNNEYADDKTDLITDVDENGKFKYNSGSVTLYRISSKSLDLYYQQLGVELDQATAGNTFVLDQYSGLFLEGDSIKVSTDVLFGTLKVTDESRGGALHAYKTVSNSIDYYIPYYQIVDSLVDKLNCITRVYHMTPTQIELRNGKGSANYRVYAYTNSPVFITPTDYESALWMDTTGWTDEEIEKYQENIDSITNGLYSEFGDENIDWLGIAPLFYNEVLEEGSSLQQTLWFKTMVDNGYYEYGENGTYIPNDDKLSNLITYVNRVTKKFVFDISDRIGTMSDDSLVKVIALRAVLGITQEVSDLQHWLYPFSVNYSEFTLSDVLQSALVSNYTDYAHLGYSLPKYLNEEFSWFAVLVYDVDVVILFLLTWTTRMLTTLIYVLLILVIILNLFTRGELKSVTKGFLKVCLMLGVVILLQTVSIQVCSMLNSSPLGLFVILVLGVVAIYVLVILISSLLFNVMDFGNTAINARFGKLPSFVNNLKNMNVNAIDLRKMKPDFNPAIASMAGVLGRTTDYGFDADIDELYDSEISSSNTEVETMEVDSDLLTDDEILNIEPSSPVTNVSEYVLGSDEE